MKHIVDKALIKLQNVSLTSKTMHTKTGDICKISQELFKELEDKSIHNVLNICKELLDTRNWKLSVIAFDFAYRIRKEYTDNMFDVFESWLYTYVRNWGDCNDFCTHAFGYLLQARPYLYEKNIPWTKSNDFWVRRASAVILILSIKNEVIETSKVFKISDLLMNDDHDLVRKGYGWMLKVLSTKNQQIVFDYLMKHKTDMPRVSFRYALEKMDKELKKVLMS